MKKVFVMVFAALFVWLGIVAQELAPKDFTMQNDDKVARQTIEFPAVAVKPGERVILVFDARVVTKTFAGWSNVLKLQLNGKKIDAEDAGGKQRLLYRGLWLKTNHKSPTQKSVDWWRNRKNEALLMLFAPLDAVEVNPLIVSPRDCGYEYAIDISDLVNRLVIGADDRIEANAANRLEFRYLMTKHEVNGEDMPLSVKDLRLEFLSEEAADKARPGMAQSAAFSRVPQKAVASISSGVTKLEVCADGAMQIVSSNGEIFYIDSKFSYPEEPVMRFNYFGAGSTNLAKWKPEVKRVSGNVLNISAQSEYYRVTRTITAEKQRFAVKDVIQNLSKRSNLGLAYSEIFSSKTAVRNAVRLAGQKPGLEKITFFGSSNPTVWIPGKKSGVGAVYIDTLSRAQLELGMTGNQVTAGSAGCGTVPAGSIEREWAIYPVPENEYFGLVNRIRQDWGVNRTIPGWVCFLPHGRGKNPDSLPTYQPLHRWFEFYYSNGEQDGANLSRDEYVAYAQKEMEEMRKLNPNVKFIVKLESNLVPFDCSKVDFGSEIPQQDSQRGRSAPGVKYGQFASPELSRKLESTTPLADSLIRSADGSVMIDNLYPVAPYINLMVQPELGNARFKQMLEQIDFLIDNLPIDAIYIDQFQPYLIGGTSEDRWDGHSVELTPAGRIKKMLYSYAYKGASGRAAIIRHIIERGKFAMTNGQSMSREEQAAGGYATQEMENDTVNPLLFLDEKPPEFRWQSISHLGCPVAEGIRPRRYIDVNKRPNQAARLQIKALITALRNGLLYSVYIADMPLDGAADGGSLKILENMYPFTPVELHAGWLMGKERTITACSGEFTVAGSQPPKLLHFDNQGVLYKECNWKVSGKPGSWKVSIVLNDWNEVGIINVQDSQKN